MNELIKRVYQERLIRLFYQSRLYTYYIDIFPDCVTWVNGSHGEVPSSAWDATLTTGSELAFGENLELVLIDQQKLI